MIWLKQSTASQEIPLGYFLDSTDGDTEETALTIANTDIKLWKTGATTLASKNSGGATHISNGIYYATLDATDTNTLGPMVIFVHVSGALTVRLETIVLPSNVYDSLVAGSDTLNADVIQWLGTAVATPATAGVPSVDTVYISGDSAAADNIESDYDGTGYNKSNSTIGTCTTNTDMRGTDSALLASSAPTNFSDLAITASTGRVTVGTNNDKTGYSISGSITTLDGLENLSQAEANAACDTALSDYDPPTYTELLNLHRLQMRSDAAINTDLSSLLTTINSDLGSGAGDYDNQTDSTEGIRDQGDASWTTGGGGSISDILNIRPLIPNDIDLANTATVRIGIMLTNALDDLPTTAEITPGTIDIDRKAIGGTSWTSVVSGASCSESAGQIYYDEVFDSGTGYAEGDSIRITFKSQKITVSANDYEITDATGVMFQTSIRQTMRGTDSAATASALATAQADLDTITGSDGVTLATTQGNYAPAKASDVPTAAQNRAEMDSNSTQLAAIVADTSELQGDWADGGRLDLLIDAILADTNELQSDDVPGLIAALNDPTAAAIASAVVGTTCETEGTYTVKQILSIVLAVCAGQTTDAGATLKTPNGVATRVAATTNASNERTAMTLTPSS